MNLPRFSLFQGQMGMISPTRISSIIHQNTAASAYSQEVSGQKLIQELDPNPYKHSIVTMINHLQNQVQLR